jgi:hypothetical protein
LCKTSFPNRSLLDLGARIAVWGSRTFTTSFVPPLAGSLRIRSRVAHTRAVLQEMFGVPALTSGIAPIDRGLMAVQLAAESSGTWFEALPLPDRVWTDGSCLHPADSPLRRAAWAVVGLGPAGCHTLGAAIVHGRQTNGRAELSAVIWVSRCPGSALAVIDAKYPAHCLAKCCGGLCPPALLEGLNGDL